MHAGNLIGSPYAIVAMRDLLDAVFAALTADPRGALRTEPKAAAGN